MEKRNNTIFFIVMIVCFCGIMAVLNNSFNTKVELPTIDSTKVIDTVHLKPGFDFLQGGDIEKAENKNKK